MAFTLSPLTKKISLTMAVVFFIFSAGLFYINKILLPIQVRGMAIKAASDALKRNVTFDALQYSPLKGFIVTDLVIAKKDDPSQVFVRAKSVSARVLLLALLQKKLIIPALRIESPEISLTRTAPDLWNFSDLIPTPGAAAPQKPPMDVIVSGLNLTNGRIVLNDIAPGSSFSEAIEIPSVKGSLSLQGSFNMAGDILLPATKGSLTFETRIGIKDSSFKGTFTAKNIALDRYLRFSPSALPVNIKDLMIADAGITALTDGKNISISGDITLPSFHMTLPDGTTVRGDFALAKFLAGTNKDDISVQGEVSSHTLSVETAAGLRAALSGLHAAGAQAAVKKGSLTASGDIDVRELDLKPGDTQRLKTSLSIQDLTVSQGPDGYSIGGDVKADNLSMTMDKDQSVSGIVVIRKLTALINGSAIQAKGDLDVKDAAVNLPGTSIKTGLTAPEMRFAFDTGRIETELHASFKDLAVTAQNISAKGSPELAAHVVFDPKSAIPLSYTGTLKVSSLGLGGIPTVSEIKNIRGEITFKTDIASTDNLSFSVLNTPVNVSGEISNFKDPRINASAAISKADLSLIEKFIPDLVKEQNLSIKGTAAVDVNFAGLLSQVQNGTITANARIADASLESKKLNQSVSSVNGLITYKSPVLSWKDLAVNYQGKTWTSQGSLQDFLNPVISANITTDNLTAKIEAKKKDDKLQLTSLSGTYFDSTYELIGDIFLTPGQNPSMDMNGEFKLSLRDLPKMLPPPQAKQVEALELAGILKIKTRVKGVPQNWQDLVSTASIETPALYMKGYQIADLSINAKQKDGKIAPLTITGKLYGGDLNTTAEVSLKEDKFPFTLGAKLENTSLELLKKDTPLKQQQLSGLVNATADLKGDLLDIRSMKGTAAIKISNGYLWSLQILSKVLSILSSTFQGGDVIITDADGTFQIADQKIITDDLTLRSATVTLLAEGWVDFDQNIDMNITPRIEPKAADGTTSPLAVINPTDGLVNILVYNTLTAPKFEHNLSAPKMIKKTIQNTVGNLLKIFE